MEGGEGRKRKGVDVKRKESSGGERSGRRGREKRSGKRGIEKE